MMFSYVCLYFNAMFKSMALKSNCRTFGDYLPLSMIMIA